jgi:hypothetical protein
MKTDVTHLMGKMLMNSTAIIDSANHYYEHFAFSVKAGNKGYHPSSAAAATAAAIVSSSTSTSLETSQNDGQEEIKRKKLLKTIYADKELRCRFANALYCLEKTGMVSSASGTKTGMKIIRQYFVGLRTEKF